MAGSPYPSNQVGGQGILYGLVDAGPTHGRVRRPIFPISYITSGIYIVQPYDFELLVNFNGEVRITMPLCSTWMRQPYGGFPLIIKDSGGWCSLTNFIRVFCSGSDTVDGATSQDLINSYGAMTWRPRDDLTGWYVT